MDQPYSGNDVSLSPSQILERLQVLRQLQLLQRGKLQKQRLQYEETTETSSSITEIVSQFSNTTSYNTFRSLLQSSNDTSNDVSPRFSNSNITANLKEKDLVEGVSILNLSQESEFIVTSPGSARSALPRAETVNGNLPKNKRVETNPASKKVISLDEMPILSPKQNFEAMLIEKLKNEKPPPKAKSPKKDLAAVVLNKKPFLRRGEGMSRFGIKKNDLVIQNTQSLPWRRKSLESRTTLTVQKPQKKGKVNVQIIVTEPKKHISPTPIAEPSSSKEISRTSLESEQKEKDQDETLVDSSNCEAHGTNKPSPKLQIPKAKHPLLAKKGKTWAAVLTKEQDEFLRQLKQSEYYKNFTSPAKSTISDMSCDNNMSKLRQEREIAEQNMFELLENKVCNESFHLENSFFSKFLRRSQLECSGESTPLIMKTCLASNPELLHIFPDIAHKNKNENTQLEVDSHNEYTETECDSDNCSSVCSCCSCKTIEPANITAQSCTNNKQVNKNANQKDLKINRKEVEKKSETELQDDSVTEVDTIKANMAEMNAKLIATSELLKDRLRELEDEIETFRKENVTLAKMREEIELERQKFYEEKNTFQQKFNEEKILSEYYLAEEKEKLTKQRQMYERYVKDMRGRLNKKEKDEILNLKKEISDLKEEIRNKDAKTTSTIARLRNQLKIMEKEKKDLQDQVEKLKKENRRIQHSNDITRRLSNMKYLEEINKKLSHMSSKETQSAVELDSDTKYKVHEIERQSRSRKIPHVTKSVSRPRAKSVPNLNVTSRYAKYFSQRDTVSQMDRDKMLNDKDFNTYCTSDNSINNSMDNNEDTALDDTESIQGINLSNETENHLERIYMERFQSTSPVSNRSSFSNPRNSNSDKLSVENPDNFFLHKSNSSSNSDSKTPNHSTVPPYQNSSSGSNTNRSKSPISILNHKSSGYKSPRGPTLGNYGSNIPDKSHSATLTCAEVLSQISKSPVSILSNRSSGSLRPTVIDQDQFKDKLALSPEPSTSKTSLTKTNLNPTEIKKSDGSRELRFPNGNVKHISADGKYTKFVYYNGDVKENFYNEGRIKYFYAEAKTCHTTHADGLEVLEFPDGQVEKRYKDGSTEIRLPNGSIRYFDPKNEHIREEWRFPDGTALTVSACGEQRIVFSNGQVEVHAKDHKRREFPDGTMKLVYNDGTSETRYASGRVRIKDKHGNLIMDSAPG